MATNKEANFIRDVALVIDLALHSRDHGDEHVLRYAEALYQIDGFLKELHKGNEAKPGKKKLKGGTEPKDGTDLGNVMSLNRESAE